MQEQEYTVRILIITVIFLCYLEYSLLSVCWTTKQFLKMKKIFFKKSLILQVQRGGVN